MNILYEDEEIIVAIKDYGVSSQETPDKKGFVNIIKAHLSDNGKNEPYIGTIHRLDTAVSGVMVYAKTPFSAAALSRAITDNTFKKQYTAVVHGCPDSTTGTYEDLLFKDSGKNKSFVVKRERKGVKKASLGYEVISSAETEKGKLTLVKINLHTGRTHQIRVQFSSRKMPLYGDGKYGASDNIPFIALFCSSLTFPHPKTKKTVTFSASPESIFPWTLFNT